MLTFGAMLIQLEMGWSDRQLEEESRFDDRCKYAFGVSRDFAGIDAVTLCEHRARFIESGIIFTLFRDLLADAKQKTSSPRTSSGIVIPLPMGRCCQDTYTLL